MGAGKIGKHPCSRAARTSGLRFGHWHAAQMGNGSCTGRGTKGAVSTAN